MQLLDSSLVNGQTFRIKRDFLTIGNYFGCVLCLEQGRHPEFPGHGGQVAGSGTDIGYKTHRLVDNPGKLRGGMTGNKNASHGKIIQVPLLGKDPGRSNGNALHGGNTPPPDENRILFLQVMQVTGTGRSCLLQTQLPGLENNHPVLWINGKFYILGPLEIFFQPHADLGKFPELLRGQARLPALVFMHTVYTGSTTTSLYHGFGFMDNLYLPDFIGRAAIKNKMVGRHFSGNNGFPQSPGRVDNHGFVFRPYWIIGVENAAGFGRNHELTGDRHHDLMGPEVHHQTIFHGFRTVEAGQDLLIGLGDFL